MAEVFVGEDQANAGRCAGCPNVKTDNGPFPDRSDGERGVKDIGSHVVSAEQNRTTDFVMGVDARSVGEWHIAH